MSDTNVYQRIKLHVNNARSGQMIKVYVSKGDSPVAWSSGPAFETDSSINIISSSGGIVPLRALAINAEQISIDFHGSAVPGSFTIELYLVAQTGIQTFKLKYNSDSGPSVHLSLGDADPIGISYKFADFSWPS